MTEEEIWRGAFLNRKIQVKEKVLSLFSNTCWCVCICVYVCVFVCMCVRVCVCVYQINSPALLNTADFTKTERESEWERERER